MGKPREILLQITGSGELLLGKNEKIVIDGFYDGDGIYKVRFMPSFEGDYKFLITGNFSDETF